MMDRNTYAGKRTMLTSVEKLLEVCNQPSPARQLDPAEWELTLPRIRLEDGKEDWDWNRDRPARWVAECWWRSVANGSLGCYAKRDLVTLQLREFRELPQEKPCFAERDLNAQRNYLEQAVKLLNSGTADMEEAQALDELWKRLAPADTLPPVTRMRQDTFLIPEKTLEYWDWEKIRDLLLKRWDTTVEELRVRMAARDSEEAGMESQEENKLGGGEYDRNGTV